jgi:hypothetical protein
MSTLVLLPAQVLDREQGRSLPHATDDVATQARLVPLTPDEYAEMVAHDAEMPVTDAYSPTRWNDISDRLAHPRGAVVTTCDEKREPSRSTCSRARHAACE